jgi:predicted  nucleic acid-binding Zn-ribbon protein
MDLRMRRTRPKYARLALMAGSCCLALLAGAVATPVEASKASVRNAEDLMIVDCLLPGQIRRLGAQASFMSARRPIRTTQADCQIRGGEYVAYDRANYQTALKVWMDQASSGSAEAQNYVGEIYLKGLGTAPDHDLAALWFKRASDQGFNRAKINLGFLYEQGLGVPQDRARALNLYREASGVSNDELLYASAVQVDLQARDAQIGALRQTVEQQQQEAASLRTRVSELESQLASRQRALQASQGELQATQARLAEARRATGADFASADRQRDAVAQRETEVQRLSVSLAAEKDALAQREEQLALQQAALAEREQALAGAGAVADESLQDLRARTGRLSQSLADARQRAETLQVQLAAGEAVLARERAAYQAEIDRLEQLAAGRQQEDWELMKLLEGQLAQRESEVRQAQTQIASLSRQVAFGSGAMLASVPTLELIDPPLTMTRGRPAAMLRGPAGRQSMTGRVSSPQAVAEITVNGTPVILGDNGLFRASIDVPAAGSLIQIAALDRRGESSSLEFMMVPQAQGSASAGATAATGPVGLPPGLKLGTFHALVIGNNSYQSPSYQSLQSAVNDATAVAQILRDQYGYKTNLLLNANRFQLLSALNEARESLGPDDNLLVYYAGHGEISEDGRVGYWIPTDGQAGMVNTWVSNTAISEILETMQARHVLVVADSCYSGAMTRAAMPVANAAIAEGKWDEWVRTMAAGRSRIAMTSGGVQPVPDTGTGKHSFFARAFLNALDDNNRLIEAQQLFRQITSSLALATIDAPLMQVPEYSPIQFAGHETGDFFFVPMAAGRRTGP